MIFFQAKIASMNELYILHDFFNSVKDKKEQIYVSISDDSCSMVEGICNLYKEKYNLNINHFRITPNKVKEL